MAVDTAFVGAAILVIHDLSDVPAVEPLTPLLAIRPSATDTSCTLYFIAPATVAAYLNDSPIVLTSVFDLLAACARTSTNMLVSSAVSPNAVSASVTMSDVCARSSPVAPARYMMPSMPAVISDTSHPAIAMYLNASVASVAENFVCFPISCAFSDSACSSSPVAPQIAWTPDMPSSKSAATLIAATPAPTIGTVTAVVIDAPTAVMLFPAFWICFPARSHCLALFFNFAPAELSGLVILSISLSVTSTNFPLIFASLPLLSLPCAPQFRRA